MFTNGELYRPSYIANALLDTVGYVHALWVEQENSRDTIRFTMQIYAESGDELREFWLPLDTNTTVVLAQFQLLLDAMRSRWDGLRSRSAPPLLVRVHFSFHDVQEAAWVYWLGIYEGRADGTSVNDFYYPSSVITGGWYAQGFGRVE